MTLWLVGEQYVLADGIAGAAYLAFEKSKSWQQISEILSRIPWDSGPQCISKEQAKKLLEKYGANYEQQ